MAWLRASSTRRALALCAGAFTLSLAIVGGARLTGLLQEPELASYDMLLRMRSASCADPRVVLVSETEADLRRFGHPWSDAFLTELLTTLARQRPAVIGVDKYRDIPVPPGTAELDQLLRQTQNVVWIFRFGSGASLIPPPAALRDTDRAAFNDVVDDPDGVVRRALLFLDDCKTAYQAFALALALQYLKPQGIALGPVAGRDEALQLGKSVLAPLERDQGAYARVDTAGFQMLVDYRCRPAFATHSVADVIDGKIGGLEGKAVIVGARAESLGDFLYTPLSKGPNAGERVTGADLHATVVSQLVRLASGEA